jgi:hypothetical protein
METGKLWEPLILPPRTLFTTFQTAGISGILSRPTLPPFYQVSVLPSVVFSATRTGVLGPQAQTPEIPYARSSHPPLNTKYRSMVKAEKRNLSHGSGHALGRGRVSTQLIFSHL